ncbi:hypothetical protein B5C34_12590 [Pacificimonas flava]|uniref:histidine kinase n=2 Tax=Pacificimonas TaxID=1960290 RepID=A0A219B747_9SPHN|nr:MULTISPECIES: ATP-binding protein [Pacificimonas]MBZ6378496.1 HAMP domain-containing protein [Pacificimonas aurantium]OWV34212.1 hypothetical protein B5C34_12590 [Pacificimonas flava]
MATQPPSERSAEDLQGPSQTALVRRRLSRLSGRVSHSPKLELAAGFLACVSAAVAILSISGGVDTGPLGPLGRTVLLVLIMLPFMALLILLARRVAVQWLDRQDGLMGARLHVRLVGLFAVLAAVPTLLTVIFASLLFQTGTQFWFSDNAQTVLRNAETVAQAYIEENRQRIVGDIFSMGGDLYAYSLDLGPESEAFREGLDWQLLARNLTEAVIFSRQEEGVRVIASSAGEDALGETAVVTYRLNRDALERAATGETAVLTGSEDRVEAVVRLDPSSPLFLYASRTVDPGALQAAERAASARSEYSALLGRSRDLQWRFNAILGAVALLVITLAILSALWLANRLTKPIADLATAAGRLGAGDLGARVDLDGARDELALLARSFNRMAGQLEVQTAALVEANEEAEARRGFIEAVLDGVSAGVLAVDGSGRIDLASSAAAELLAAPPEELIGRRLGEAVPEFAGLVEEAGQRGRAQGERSFERGGHDKTFLVRVGLVPGGERLVMTFDDITQQIADQRRAAWADVARRIAHEIKNPLTPIQLSAERIDRRFGKLLEGADRDTLESLTQTIVRQVGDLRRMVDEFSSFARMPKPTFREEPIRDLVKQSLFLQEIAQPEISFSLDVEDGLPPLICDRRQISQALTNLLKNAVEAVTEAETVSEPAIALAVAADESGLLITITDNGPGMPRDLRDRITEPYVTTRAGGTGLGLAIVKKIVEEHAGTLGFADLEGAGTRVFLSFPPGQLAGDPRTRNRQPNEREEA